MQMWNSSLKLVQYWRLKLGLINGGRLLNPMSALSSLCVLLRRHWRHLEDEPLGHAFFSPESVKALTGAELSPTERS